MSEAPAHYAIGGIEAIDYIRAKLTPEGYIGYLEGNILKYLSRWRHKGGLRDLHKAQEYLGWLIAAQGSGAVTATTTVADGATLSEDDLPPYALSDTGDITDALNFDKGPEA